MNSRKLISIVLVLVMILANTSFVFAVDVDLTDVGTPPYVRAEIPRKNVVVCADPTTVPPALADRVIRTYPDGKMKAFLLSFDDGGGNGANAGDWHILRPLFQANNLMAAFNLNMRDDAATSGPLMRCINGVGTWASGYTSAIFKTLVLEQYDGYEVGNHGTNHWSDYNLNKDRFRYEIGKAKNIIETMFSREAAGYIRAGGGNSPDAEIAPAEWRKAYLQYAGQRYVRNAPIKNYIYATKPADLKYDVPTDFYNWNPTIQITNNSIFPGYTTMDIFNYYLTMDPNNSLKVFFGWGHSTDISSTSYSAYTVTPNSGYAPFATLCETAHQNEALLWNPTPIDYTDYINAMWKTTLAEGTNGDIIATNTSGAVDVWFKINGQNVKVPWGKVVTVGSDGVIKSTVDGEIVTGIGYIAPPDPTPTPSLTPSPTPSPTPSQEPNPNGKIVESTNRVSVYGDLGVAKAGKAVTLLMVKTEANVATLTKSDIGHISQAVVAADGTYTFDFKFTGFAYDTNNVVTNYKVLLNADGQNVTPSITKAIVTTPVTTVNLDLTLANNLATAALSIENALGIESGQYTMVLAFISENGQLLGVSVAPKKTIASNTVTDSLPITIPTGTKTVKAFVWDSIEKMIPLCESNIKTVQ